MGNVGRIVMIVLIVGVCCTGKAQEVELQIGKDVYEGTNGVPIQVAQITPSEVGNAPIVVPTEEILAYSKGGISFNYGSLMKVSSDEEPEGITIKIESELSPMLAIQEYRSQIDPEEILSTLIDSLKNALKERKVVITDKYINDATMNISSENRTGKSLDFSIKGLQHKTSVFAIPASNRTIGMIFQYSADDAELAKKQFEIITDSLTIQ